MNKIALLIIVHVFSGCYASEKIFSIKQIDITSIINRKDYQEDDCYYAEVDGGLLGIMCDGHDASKRGLGALASRFLKKNFPVYFNQYKNLSMKERMIETFKECDKKMIEYFKQEEKDEMAHYKNCGSTAVVAFIKDGVVHFAHAGDSRAAIIGQKGEILFATTDHKVDNPQELLRMQRAGAHAYIELGNAIETSRICGLAVSRAFGDYCLKEYMIQKCGSSVVIAEPEYTAIELKEHKFLILATDGLWDALPNEEVAQITQRVSAKFEDKNIANITHLLVKKAIDKGSTDNITVMLVDLLS